MKPSYLALLFTHLISWRETDRQWHPQSHGEESHLFFSQKEEIWLSGNKESWEQISLLWNWFSSPESSFFPVTWTSLSSLKRSEPYEVLAILITAEIKVDVSSAFCLALWKRMSTRKVFVWMKILGCILCILSILKQLTTVLYNSPVSVRFQFLSLGARGHFKTTKKRSHKPVLMDDWKCVMQNLTHWQQTENLWY